MSDAKAVDSVLADIWHRGLCTENVRDFEAARAAIAGLIEHDKVLREALETCERWFTRYSPTAPLIGGQGEAEHPMLTMLRTALRACGGA